MSGPQFSTPGSPTESVRDDYHQEQYDIDQAVEQCRYCKAAKTRKAAAQAKTPTARLDGMPDECRHHRSLYRTSYACSPVSETYWSS